MKKFLYYLLYLLIIIALFVVFWFVLRPLYNRRTYITAPDEVTKWLYAFSTLSQVCAAIIAFGATFVVFKLDKLYTAINKGIV